MNAKIAKINNTRKYLLVYSINEQDKRCNAALQYALKSTKEMMNSL